jgi:hypothetical protein
LVLKWYSFCSIYVFLCSVLSTFVCPFVFFIVLSVLLFDRRLLITLLFSSLYCPSFSSIVGYWLHFCFLHCIVRPSLRPSATDYTFVFFIVLSVLLFDRRLLITLLFSSLYCSSFSSTVGFWLHFWYLNCFPTLTGRDTVEKFRPLQRCIYTYVSIC